MQNSDSKALIDQFGRGQKSSSPWWVFFMLIIVCIQPLICKHTAVRLFPIGDTRSCYDAQNQEAAAVVAVSPKEKSAASVSLSIP